MILTFLERITLLQILPPEGDILTLRIIRDLKTILPPTEKEIKEHNIRQDNDQIKWDRDFETEIEIGDKAKKIIQEALQTLDKNKKLTEQHISLFDKFLETSSTS